MIRVEHLTKRFGTVVAVNEVSFKVEKGETFALLGPNGSGKTTTLKTIAGLSLPTSGKVYVAGIDAHAESKRAKANISFLPQKVSFPENLTARELVRFYGSLRKLTPSMADEALGKANFNGWSDKSVGEFSGGMIQRLGLAIVAMPQTPVLILDEPTASLDPQGVMRFRGFILEQKKLGTTIIFSTHLLAEAEQLADRVGIFLHGRLLAEEPIEDLRRSFDQSGSLEELYLDYMNANEHETH